MASSPETPWLIGAIDPLQGQQQLPAAGKPLWSDTPHIRQGGDWWPEELRKYEHPMGRVAVVGSCLASGDEFTATARQALEQQDPTALADLPGSYTSIMYTERGLDIVGDRVDQRPLYVRGNVQGASFGTHMRSLFPGSDTLQPDLLSLAVAIGTPWRYELAEGRTVARGVARSSARHHMHVDADGYIYRTPYDVLPSSGLNSAETAAALREVMVDAAKRRVATGRAISSDFSGGLDSTSAAFVLANQLNQRLITITQHSPDIPVDDMQYVEAYMKLPESSGKFEHHIFERSAADAMFTGIFDLPPVDAPGMSIRSLANAKAYCQYLRGLGSELHVQGIGADSLFDMSPRKYLGTQAAFGNMPFLARAIMQTARSERDSPRHVVSDMWHYARTNPAAELRTLAHTLAHWEDGEPLDPRIFEPATAPQWLTPAMRKDMAAYAESVAADTAMPEGMDPATYKTYTALLSFGLANYSITELIAGMGLRQQLPFLDNDVLKLCFGLPAHERMNPWEFKPLLRQAMQGIVPAPVLARTTKGDYTKHGYRGLRAAAPMLRHLLTDMRLADLGVIDPAKVRHVFEQGISGAPMPWASFDALLAHEWWLRSLDGDARPDAYIALPPSTSVTRPEALQEALPLVEPLDGAQQFSMPPGVVIAKHANGAGVINLPRQLYERLNGAARDILTALQSTDSLEAAHETLAGMYPSLDSSKLRAATDACIRDMLRRGMLVEGAGEYAVLEGGVDDGAAMPAQMIRVPERTPHVTVADYGAALGGMALVALSGGARSIIKQKRLLDLLRSLRVGREASPDEATRMLAATRRLADISLGRVACLETALTAAVGSVLRGRHVDVVLGMRLDPEGHHAWPEVSGQPITTLADEPVEGMYRPLIRL